MCNLGLRQLKSKGASVAVCAGLLLGLMGLTACGHLRTPRIPKPKPGQITLKASAAYKRYDDRIIRRVYVFPALEIDEQGVPTEELYHSLDEKGHLIWHAPAEKSRLIQSEIERLLEKRGFRLVPYQDVLDPRYEHAILVFNPYYTSVLAEKEEDGKHVYVLFIKLLASTIPGDLDLLKKKDRINQESLVRFHPSDDVDSVTIAAFRNAVKNIGKNEQWVEIFQLSDSQ